MDWSEINGSISLTFKFWKSWPYRFSIAILAAASTSLRVLTCFILLILFPLIYKIVGVSLKHQNKLYSRDIARDLEGLVSATSPLILTINDSGSTSILGRPLLSIILRLLIFLQFFTGTNFLPVRTLSLSPLLNAILEVKITEIEFFASPMAPNMGL